MISLYLEQCWSKWEMGEENMVNHWLAFNTYAQK